MADYSQERALRNNTRNTRDRSFRMFLFTGSQMRFVCCPWILIFQPGHKRTILLQVEGFATNYFIQMSFSMPLLCPFNPSGAAAQTIMAVLLSCPRIIILLQFHKYAIMSEVAALRMRGSVPTSTLSPAIILHFRPFYGFYYIKYLFRGWINKLGWKSRWCRCWWAPTTHIYSSGTIEFLWFTRVL